MYLKLPALLMPQGLVELLVKSKRWAEAEAAAAGRPELLAAFHLAHAQWLDRTGHVDAACQAYR
jgi:hypothetical protein